MELPERTCYVDVFDNSLISDLDNPVKSKISSYVAPFSIIVFASLPMKSTRPMNNQSGRVHFMHRYDYRNDIQVGCILCNDKCTLSILFYF